ncbi:CDP-alcohol phosphatidyltransferase family protein [Micromonospora sp. DT48]|uniref:CDP-alcohol phosphatidyltransferase family protein n=1 Tax=unclassified Micromonospora TaxID=2617518 RepID=UPI0012BD308B|nr:CDP-alcohol phosphatidyltransferase family protein [Micromonospora sp. CP22]MTK03482.1 CDP-alcohol phosphatidyltransferase family protein [Micromonospora sp. CP22]
MAEPGIGARVATFFRHDIFSSGARGGTTPTATDQVFTWANGITFIRLAGMPVIVYLIIGRGAYGVAFVLLWTFAALDVLDGYLARRLNQVTRVGTWLDPITDRVTIAALVVSLLVVDLLPWWVALGVLLRELTLALVVGVITRGAMARPVTRSGKIGTLALLVGLPGYLLPAIDLPWASVLHAGTLALTVLGLVLYYASLVQYARAALAIRPGRSRRQPERV